MTNRRNGSTTISLAGGLGQPRPGKKMDWNPSQTNNGTGPTTARRTEEPDLPQSGYQVDWANHVQAKKLTGSTLSQANNGTGPTTAKLTDD